MCVFICMMYLFVYICDALWWDLVTVSFFKVKVIN